MPEKYFKGKRPIIPLWGKRVSIVVGEPFQLNITELRKEAQKAVENGDLNFGKDCFLPSLKIESGKSEEEEESEEEKKEKERLKLEKIEGVGDEVTRRLYSEIMSRIQDNLEPLVLRAHKCVDERS